MEGIKFVILFLIVTCFLSCLKGDYNYEITSTWDDYFYDCEFVEHESNEDMWTSLEEIAIADYCEDNQIESLSEIKASLIGEWELVGHSNGDGTWIGLHNQPCIYFWIEDEDMVIHFEDIFLDTIFRTTWDVEIDDDGHILVFDHLIYTLDNIKLFSDQYICSEKGDDWYTSFFERRE